MSEDYQMVELNELRERKALSLFGFIIVNGTTSDFIGTGKWFTWVTIREHKVKERTTDFDGGWTYEKYWKPWKEKWVFITIINNE